MKVKYIGNKKNLKLDRKDLSKKYDFSKGVAEVSIADVKVMKAKMSNSFAFLEEDTKDNSDTVTG